MPGFTTHVVGLLKYKIWYPTRSFFMSKSKAGPKKRKPGHFRNSIKKLSGFITHLVLCSNQVHIRFGIQFANLL